MEGRTRARALAAHAAAVRQVLVRAAAARAAKPARAAAARAAAARSKPSRSQPARVSSLTIDQASEQETYASQASVFDSHVEALQAIIVASNEPLEGNSVYIHNSLTKSDRLVSKRLNLFWAGRTAASRICEIGFNAGHSCLTMLLGRQTRPTTFTIFDICAHSYVLPALKYMQAQFPHVSFAMHGGDSTMTMPKWIADNPSEKGSYDVVHVDGGHTKHCITHDMANSALLVRKGGLIVVDDTHIPHINAVVDRYLGARRASVAFVEVTGLFPTSLYTHRIIQRVA